MHCITELACELLDTQSKPSCASQRANHTLACVRCFEHLPKVDCMQGMTAARCATAAHKPDIAKMLETRIHKMKRPTGGTSGRTRQADAVQTAPPAFSPAIRRIPLQAQPSSQAQSRLQQHALSPTHLSDRQQATSPQQQQPRAALQASQRRLEASASSRQHNANLNCDQIQQDAQLAQRLHQEYAQWQSSQSHERHAQSAASHLGCSSNFHPGTRAWHKVSLSSCFCAGQSQAALMR